MTHPQETGEGVKLTSHGEGEPDELRNDENRPSGSDVGGPATTSESALERSVTEPSSAGEDSRPDSQSRNPL